MTKVSVFGQETRKEGVKPIEFVKIVYSCGQISDAVMSPSKWENVMLFRPKVKADSFDIILAFDGSFRAVFLGHWNDGVI